MTDPATALLTPAQHAHIVNIIRRAAKSEILPRYQNLSAADVTQKSSDADLVTVADTEAEAMITRALAQAFPDAVILGEEAVSRDPSLLDKIKDAPLAFIIDPVDGTWNFVHGLGVFGVILSATHFGRPIFGVIYDPLSDDWAIAHPEGRAQMVTAAGVARPLKAAMGKRIEALTGHIPLHMFPMPQRVKLAATLPSFCNTHSLKCSAHEYRMIAQGQVDFVLTQSLWPWDHAAGALICQQAGAHVEMLDGGAYTAARHEGHLLVAPDRTTWNKLHKVFSFLLSNTDTP